MTPLDPRKLNLAFVWHMHQPDYKDHATGQYQMPWVRFHGIKDYLDMVLILRDFPTIRQTFNLVPSLIDQIQDYAHHGAHDQNSLLMTQSALSPEDKLYILARAFDAHPQTMVAQSPTYQALAQKRYEGITRNANDPDVLTEAEAFDALMWMNLVWFDPLWLESYPDLVALRKKDHGFTVDERQRVIAIQREILGQIIPTYKAFQESGQIEVTSTPYYHPITPLLIDSDSAKIAMPFSALPKQRYQAPEDARLHVQRAAEQYQRLFDRSPCGIWPSEQSISPDALALFSDCGFQWAISSEGNLAASLGVGLEKDPYGNVLNVSTFCRAYEYNGLKLVFRNLALSDLIGFNYMFMPAHQAADDLMARIKGIQQRCAEQQVDYPLVVIALDGENCWESYANDGHDFLKALYQRLSHDESINVCRVQDYLSAVPESAITPLSHVHSGSWIASNFHIWIGDPVKNTAWDYLQHTRQDLIAALAQKTYSSEVEAAAWEEIYIAEGSDWFWWYGEPNHSGQDHVFDAQFRGHLSRVYTLLGLAVPETLQIPLGQAAYQPFIAPKGSVSPMTASDPFEESVWEAAGVYDLGHGAMHRGSQFVKQLHYGEDAEHLALRITLNPEALTTHHQLVFYAITPGKTRHNSPMRFKIDPASYRAETERFGYAYEWVLSDLLSDRPHIEAAEALPDFLWGDRHDIQPLLLQRQDQQLICVMPFSAFGVWPGETLQLAMAMVSGERVQAFHPEHSLLTFHRVAVPVREIQTV